MAAKYYNPPRFIFHDERENVKQEYMQFRHDVLNNARRILGVDKPDDYDAIRKARELLGVK